MNEGSKEDTPTSSPSPDNIQEVLHKVINAHQQALALLQETETAYGRLVPHQLLKLLDVKSIVDVKLGDQVERKMSVMFSDIRDFTSMSESMTPAENFKFINSYLSQMEPVITQHRGIIDKYIGDAILALFEYGADDALSGAITMLNRLAEYNRGRERAGYKPIRIGIGMNTGLVMIGTIGGINRMDSTVIGDTVNLAARIEEATKTYHTPLIISQSTLNDLADPGKYHIRLLDRIRLKGKLQPQSIYEVFDNDPPALHAAKKAHLDKFERAVAYYHLKDVNQAIPLLEACVDAAPGDHPALIYLGRCHLYRATGQHHGTGELENGLDWSENYHTGISELDNAHHLFLAKLNAISLKLTHNDCDDCSDIFTFLEHHAEQIFPFEAQLMHQHGYPFTDHHLQEHQRFVENFTTLKQQASSEGAEPRYLAFRTELLLLDWLNSHTLKSDRHLARFIQNHGAK